LWHKTEVLQHLHSDVINSVLVSIVLEPYTLAHAPVEESHIEAELLVVDPAAHAVHLPLIFVNILMDCVQVVWLPTSSCSYCRQHALLLLLLLLLPCGVLQVLPDVIHRVRGSSSK
jgi:hypothetical protein